MKRVIEEQAERVREKERQTYERIELEYAEVLQEKEQLIGDMKKRI